MDIMMPEMDGYQTIGAIFFFFFQAEDGIRDVAVTGVQTCALPIWAAAAAPGRAARPHPGGLEAALDHRLPHVRVAARREPLEGGAQPVQRARAGLCRD